MSQKDFRFLFGLGGFVLVAWLIEQYDSDHGSNWFWAYAVVVLLGYAIANRPALTSGLAAVSSTSRDPHTAPATGVKAGG